MKKLFSLLTLALLTMSAWAQTTVTLDLTAQGYTNQQEVTSLTVDNVTVTFDKGTNTNTPKYYTSGNSVRVYGGGTVTISTSGSDPITGITFTYGDSDGNNAITCDVGTFESPNWTGSADEVVFTIGGTSGNRRFAQIEVTLGGEVVETLAAPEFSPADGTSFVDSQEITLTCATAGATISYSTDGLAWQTYTEPFTITETTTVYAKSAKGDDVSEVVTATYTKLVPVEGNLVTFNHATDMGNGSTERGEWTVEKNGVTLYCSDGTIYSDNYRIYQGANLIISSTVGNIVKIEFDGVSGRPISNLTPSTGTLTTDGYNGTWIGEAASVTFAASAQTRATEIRVYVLGDVPVEIAAPTIPASQNFEESITVEITNNAEGATVMYNTDGETWTAYTGALTFTETTTLQAKAVDGENESTVVTATYTKVEPVGDITTLAQVNALNDDTEFEFKGDAVVTAQQGQYLWLRDATGYGLIYGTIEGEFTNGQVLSQNWTAKKTTFRGLTEYTNAANLSASGVTNTALAAAQEITALSEDMINAYVMVKNVTSFTVSGKNVTANFEDGTTMVMYNQFNAEVPTDAGNYTVEGAVGKYNENLQLYILSIEGYTPEEHNVNSIAEAYALPENATFTMFDEMVVTYQKGNRLWIRDTEGTSGMIYGDLDATFENGQVLTDGWSATYAIYNNVPEFTNPVDVEADGDNTRDAAPYVRETITNANVNEYVILKGLTLLPDADNAKRFYNAADSLVIFNSFNVEIPEVQEGKTYDVTGIVTIYYGNPQIYITEMTEVAAAGKRGDVNLDNVVNIADVTTLIDYLLSGDATGISLENANCNQDASVNIADVTTLIDYLLSGTW
jgi:hypothetical protein